MLGAASTLANSVPSAFNALGIGSVSATGMLVLTITTINPLIDASPLNGFRDVLQGSKNFTPLPTGALVLVSFAYLFFTYACGLFTIHLGSRFRSRMFGGSFDAPRIAYVVDSKNEFLQKIFLETRSAITVYDGLGLALLFFLLGVLAGFLQILVLPTWGSILTSLAGLSASIACSWAFWRESYKAAENFDRIIAYRKNGR